MIFPLGQPLQVKAKLKFKEQVGKLLFILKIVSKLPNNGNKGSKPNILRILPTGCGIIAVSIGVCTCMVYPSEIMSVRSVNGLACVLILPISSKPNKDYVS